MHNAYYHSTDLIGSSKTPQTSKEKMRLDHELQHDNEMDAIPVKAAE